MKESEWVMALAQRMSSIIRESPGELASFLEKRGEEAAAAGSYDELYVIYSFLITNLLKRGELERALELRQRQRDIEPIISPEVVRTFADSRQTGFAELFLRKGQLQEAEQELKYLLHHVPIASPEVSQIMLILAGFFYTKGEWQEAVNIWLLYTYFIELNLLLVTKGITQVELFPNMNISYPLGLKYIFEVEGEKVQKKIADGCVRLCRLLLGPSSQYLSISTDDIPFLQTVAQWLIARGCLEEAEEVNRCIGLYRESFQATIRAVQERGYHLRQPEQGTEKHEEA